MNTEAVTLDVDENSYAGKMTLAGDPSEHGILVIPGAGHGPFGDIFDRFAAVAARDGHTVVRFEMWESQEDLAEKTATEFETDLDAGIEFLQSRGYSTITVVAKSFGGRLALTHIPDAADRMVLWAPAILFGARDDRPSITTAELADTETPVRILQGDEDEVVSVENAAAIAEHLPNGSVVELAGEDHSFLNDEQRIIEETLAFLSE